MVFTHITGCTRTGLTRGAGVRHGQRKDTHIKTLGDCAYLCVCRVIPVLVSGPVYCKTHTKSRFVSASRELSKGALAGMQAGG
jgi:hypothetical protein